MRASEQKVLYLLFRLRDFKLSTAIFIVVAKIIYIPNFVQVATIADPLSKSAPPLMVVETILGIKSTFSFVLFSKGPNAEVNVANPKDTCSTRSVLYSIIISII